MSRGYIVFVRDAFYPALFFLYFAHGNLSFVISATAAHLFQSEKRRLKDADAYAPISNITNFHLILKNRKPHFVGIGIH